MTRETPSAQTWFAGGERIGYEPNAHAIVRVPGAPLSVFLRREGDLAHTVSFLPGFPDGSFGWAKVLPYLPNAAQMSKLLVAYDFSSLVMLEHLRCRLERLERGEPALGPEIRGVLIFNGGLNRRAHPSVVHDADVAPPPRLGPPRRGPSPLTVQADARSKKDVVQKLPRNGSRTRRTPRRHGPSRRPVLPRRRRRLRG